MALEHARRRRPRAATAARCGPRTPRRASRHRATPRAPRPAPCGLRAPSTGAARPARQIAMRASSPLVAMRPSLRNGDRVDRAVVEAQHLLGARCRCKRPADRRACRNCRRSLACRRARSRARAPARHGRSSCACAARERITARSTKTTRTRNIIARLGNTQAVRRAHAERADAVAHASIAQRARGRPAPPGRSRRLSTRRKS